MGPANGDYEVTLIKDGFIEKITTINVNATVNGEMIDRYIIMVPNLPAGESTIVMSWETTPPQDMDIYVAAIKNSDNSICIVNFDNRQCTDAAIKLTRDLRLFCLNIQPSTANILIFWVLKIMNL